jgi:hypothetical protein
MDRPHAPGVPDGGAQAVSMERRRRGLIVALLVGGAALGAGLPVARAQVQGGVKAPETTADARGATSGRAARELTRLAALDLQATGGTNPRDFEVAAILMEIAHRLSPNDEHLLRLLIDAVSSAGDREGLLAYSKELMKLQKADTVTQLRLISGAISSRQSVESRLEGYRSFLDYKDDKGNRLDASIRSRLALDGALLLRETGDLRGFADMLGQATALDPTNKDAASLAVSFYSEQQSEPAGRLTLLINLLKADPFDPETLLAIARELASSEAFDQAERFYAVYQAAMDTQGLNVSQSIVAEANTVFWCKNNAEGLVTMLRSRVEEDRAAAERARRTAQLLDRPVDNLADPESVRLSPELERVRFAAAQAWGDQGQVDYAFTEMTRTYERAIEAAQQRQSLPAGVTAAMMVEREQRLRGELMSMRLWAGRDLDKASATLDEFRNDASLSQNAGAGAVLARLEAWLQLQRGELDAAEAALTPLAERDVLARLGRALIKERRGDREGAAKAYEALAHEASGSLAGAFARTRAEVLGQAPVKAPAVTNDLRRLASGVPGWLEQMIADPRRVVSLQARLLTTEIGAMDPAWVEVSLRNVSPIPLALGPEKPISSRLLFMPDVRMKLSRVSPEEMRSGAVVVRMDRRLRLLPQEELKVLVWADQGNLGWLTNHAITMQLTSRWNVIQGFMPHPDGRYVEGPHCVQTSTEYLQRRATRMLYDKPETLADWIKTGTSEDVAEVVHLTMMASRAAPDAPGTWSKETREAIGAALAARYPTLEPSARVLLATLLPLPPLAPWLAACEEAILADNDPDVRVVSLALRTWKVDDPRLAAARGAGEARLERLAVLVQDRLDTNTRSYATIWQRRQPAPSGGADAPPPAPPAQQPPTTPAPPAGTGVK